MSAFGSFNQTRSAPYDQRFIGQQPSFLPLNSTQSYYQKPYYSNGSYSTSFHTQLAQYGMSPASFMHPIDRQYQYQQRWNYLNEMQKNYWKQQTDAMALSLYDRPFPMSSTAGTIYPFEIKNQFIQYPDLDGFRRRRFSPQRVLGYGPPPNLVNANWANVNVRHLPPKIRAIFVPSSSIPVYQSYADPLGIPPFLFNSISQPLCSLPLPPPLPQVASLYLENNVQQIPMQPYANPVTAFPFNPNWQIPQPIIPVSSFPPYQPALTPGPGNVPIFPSQISQFPNSGYPRTYCICMPQPSSLNNSWMQYGPGYHQIPPATTNSNVPPTDNRITPLLGLSTTLTNEQNQTRQQYRNSYINEATLIDSWLPKTPPLPPGAVLVLDEYINKNTLSQEHHHHHHHHSKNSLKPTQRASKPTRRSITINTDNTSWIHPRKVHPYSETTETESDVHSRQSFSNLKSTASSHSPYSASINESIKPEKTITASTEKSENIDQKSLPAEASNVNISNLTATDDTISHSNSDALRDLRLSLAMRDNQLDLPSTTRENSVKNEDKLDQRTNVSTRTTSSFHSKPRNSKTNSIIEHETPRQTPSILRPSSRTTFASTKDTAFDSVSQASTSKTDRQDEQKLSSTNTF